MADTWNAIQQWDLVLPPSRPSSAQLRVVSDVVRRVDRCSPVAVLGSTPEFRDLLAEGGLKRIYVFDRNERFHAAMSAMRIYKNIETFVQGDWSQTLPAYTDFFSVILSDLTSGNVPYEQRNAFYKAIAKSLKKGGIFIDKVLTNQRRRIRLDTLRAKYTRVPLNLIYVNHFSCEALFCSELIDAHQKVDSSLFYGILSQRFGEVRIQAFIQSAHKITPANCLWWYGKPWKHLVRDYCRDLETLRVHDDEPESPYLGRAKQFVHTRRK